MEATILKYAPDYWDRSETSLSKQFLLHNDSEEYRMIISEVKKAVPNQILISSVERNQNLHDYGQLLIREQLQISLHAGTINYYRVRRFIKIKTQFLKNALVYNVDHRRCGLASLEFKRQLPTISNDETILVIQVVTNTPLAEVIKPDSSSEYFIEYVVKLYSY